MRIIRMLSKSGRTIYRGCVEFNQQIAKFQSVLKAQRFIYLFHLDVSLDLISKKQGYSLILNGEDLGKISKRDYWKIKNYQNEQQHCNNQNFSSSSRVSLFSSDEDISNCERAEHEVLPEISRRVHTNRTEKRVRDAVAEVISSLAICEQPGDGGSDFIEQLNRIDRELTRKEQSEYEADRRDAKITRRKIELAFSYQRLRADRNESRDRKSYFEEAYQSITQEYFTIRNLTSELANKPECSFEDLETFKQLIEIKDTKFKDWMQKKGQFVHAMNEFSRIDNQYTELHSIMYS